MRASFGFLLFAQTSSSALRSPFVLLVRFAGPLKLDDRVFGPLYPLRGTFWITRGRRRDLYDALWLPLISV